MEVKMKCLEDEKRSRYSSVAILWMAVMLLSVCMQAAVVPSSKQTLELKPGWNLVTLTRPLDSMANNVQKFLSLKPIRYDIDRGAYVFSERAEDVKAGIGYWVYSREKKTVELALDTTQTAAEPSLGKGWNLVGMMEGAAWADSATAIWGWDDGSFKLLEKKDLKAGIAYWVLMP